MFRDDLLKDHTVLVTGGGSGLGRSMTQRFCELGARVSICGRREDVLRATAREIEDDTGSPVHFQSCDVRDFEAVEAMLKRAGQ